jgi:hypothetical protein
MVAAVRANLKHAWRPKGTGGPCTTKLLSMVTANDVMPEEAEEIASYTHGGAGVQGRTKYQLKVQYTRKEHDTAWEIIVRFSKKLRKNLKMRFPKKDYEVLCALDVFDASALPPKGSLDLEMYGRPEMDVFVQYFGRAKTVDHSDGDEMMHPAIIDDKLVHEWEGLKEYMTSEGWSMGGKFSNDEITQKILTSEQCRRNFSQCCWLVEVKEVQFLETAICERGFSVMARTKRDQRTTMGSTLLDLSIRIELNGPCLSDKESVLQLCTEAVAGFKSEKQRCPDRTSAGIARTKRSERPVGDALSLLLGDAIFNDDIPSSDDEEEGRMPQVRVPCPQPVDQEQKKRDEEEELAARLAKVGVFELPTSHSSFTVVTSLDVPLPGIKERWAYLQKKVIAHKHVDGWKVGNMWKKGSGKKYGGLLWVIYDKADRGGHEFVPEEYGVDGSWVILTPPPRITTRTR